MCISAVPYYAPFRFFYDMDAVWQVVMGSIALGLRGLGIAAVCISACVIAATLIKKYR